MPLCRPAGEPCSGSSQCCSLFCGTGGYCESPSWCKPVFEPCETELDCCSYRCTRDAAGFKRCEPIGGCRPSGPVETPLNEVNYFGEVCNSNDQCCSGKCGTDAEGRARCEKLGYPLCGQPTPQVCLPAGELCETECECCGDLKCDKTRPDDMFGPFPKRCTSGDGGGGMCVADGGLCTDPGECCNGICDLHSDGEFRCGPDGGGTCVMNGSSCTTNSDCCMGLSCIPVGADLVCGVVLL